MSEENKDRTASVQRTAMHHAIIGVLKQLPLDFENKSGCDRMDIPSAAVAIENLFDQAIVIKTGQLHSELIAKAFAIDLDVNDGLPCECGNKLFTHRHSNWIECVSCNKVKVIEG